MNAVLAVNAAVLRAAWRAWAPDRWRKGLFIALAAMLVLRFATGDDGLARATFHVSVASIAVVAALCVALAVLGLVLGIFFGVPARLTSSDVALLRLAPLRASAWLVHAQCRDVRAMLPPLLLLTVFFAFFPKRPSLAALGELLATALFLAALASPFSVLAAAALRSWPRIGTVIVVSCAAAFGVSCASTLGIARTTDLSLTLAAVLLGVAALLVACMAGALRVAARASLLGSRPLATPRTGVRQSVRPVLAASKSLRGPRAVVWLRMAQRLRTGTFGRRVVRIIGMSAAVALVVLVVRGRGAQADAAVAIAATLVTTLAAYGATEVQRLILHPVWRLAYGTNKRAVAAAIVADLVPWLAVALVAASVLLLWWTLLLVAATACAARAVAVALTLRMPPHSAGDILWLGRLTLTTLLTLLPYAAVDQLTSSPGAALLAVAFEAGLTAAALTWAATTRYPAPAPLR